MQENNVAQINEDQGLKGSQRDAPLMVTIPSGEFLMGTSDEQIINLLSEEDWASDWKTEGLFDQEQPQHRVTLPAYEIGQYPIVNRQYHGFVWETGHPTPREWAGIVPEEELLDHPVVGVTLADAVAYCKWLSDKTRKEYRLPTEAEWERAARGDDGRLYPWGDVYYPWRSNTKEHRLGATTKIGTYSPAGDSPWGAIDMAGNVYEWTSSRFQAYPFTTENADAQTGSGENHIVRGGAWYYSRKLARCAAREKVLASFSSPALGFRIARSLD
ncbi:MAG: formylglycine-generating enzyme family protein [Chloroflexi bacterium]|nr:MAG: formylglycine-generating enzyme family protein [Chloroflexota bacterium]MBL1194852.1 formylglycine-generating enzyme family protein [Chloroflexota bacterium]NOH12143.1 SUMF1/EgtB/PvdO family nonheme iron enzyme [Chloroflexota bacterium]